MAKRLTEQQVSEIKTLTMKGMTQKEIAKTVGCSVATVVKKVNGKTTRRKKVVARPATTKTNKVTKTNTAVESIDAAIETLNQMKSLLVTLNNFKV